MIQKFKKQTKGHITLYVLKCGSERIEREGSRKHRQVKRKEHRANALAPGAEEGRDKLRKAAGRSTYPTIRRSPNGETHIDRLYVPCYESIVVRGEPPELKHLSRVRKRKQT